MAVMKSKGLFPKLVEAVGLRIADTHFKVSLAVMECVSKYLQLSPDFMDDLETAVDELIPKLLINISDKKEKVAKSAGLLIESLRGSYGSDSLLPALVFLIFVQRYIVMGLTFGAVKE